MKTTTKTNETNNQKNNFVFLVDLLYDLYLVTLHKIQEFEMQKRPSFKAGKLY